MALLALTVGSSGPSSIPLASRPPVSVKRGPSLPQRALALSRATPLWQRMGCAQLSAAPSRRHAPSEAERILARTWAEITSGATGRRTSPTTPPTPPYSSSKRSPPDIRLLNSEAPVKLRSRSADRRRAQDTIVGGG